MGLRGGFVRGLSDFNAAGCEKGFIYVDSHVRHQMNTEPRLCLAE